MWFKQAQIYQLEPAVTYAPEELENQLAPLAFTPCLPSLPASIGWVAPINEPEAPLVHAGNGYMMICLQFEEKVLPAAVVNDALRDKVQALELERDRKVRLKEKQSIKDEITHTLLPKAFTKKSKIAAYIDTKNNWLVIDSASTSKVESFISFLKRAVDFKIISPELKRLAPILTSWVVNNNHPRSIAIEKNAILQDPEQQNRMIRCQQQDLFAHSIQSLLKDGCQVIQLALNWNDHVKFVLNEDFSLRSIRFEDEVVAAAKDNYSETEQQRFATDFIIMIETLTPVIKTLLKAFMRDSVLEEAAVAV